MDGQAKKDLKRIGRGHHHGTVSMSEPAGLGNRCERYQKLAVLGHIFSVIVPSTYPLTDQCGGIIMALFGKACTRKPHPCSAYEIERASGAWRSKKTTTKNTGQGRGGQGRLAMGPAGISSGAGLDNGQLFPGPHVFFCLVAWFAWFIFPNSHGPPSKSQRKKRGSGTQGAKLGAEAKRLRHRGSRNVNNVSC